MLSWKLEYVVVIVLSLCSISGTCQKKSIWFGAGLSTDKPFKTSQVEQVILDLDFNYQIAKKVYLNAKYNYVDNADNKINLDHQEWVKTNAFGLCAGYFIMKSKLVITASSGVMVDIVNIYQYQLSAYGGYYSFDDTIIGFGLPVQVQILATTKWVGLGINAQYKLSSKFNYYGFGLVLIVGQIR